MLHDFAPKLANLLTTYSVPIEKGNYVVIQSTPEAIPMLEALAAAVLERGGYPHVVTNLPVWNEYFLEHATDEQLEFVNPMAKYVYEKADVVFNIDAPAHTNSTITVPATRMAQAAKASQVIQAEFFRRFGSQEMRWCLAAWPTIARAQQANMGFYAYQRFIYEASALHLDEPAAYWFNMAERQERITTWLAGKSQVEVRGPGIDLSFDFTGRNWYSASGNANFPDGEILTCPIEESVNGMVNFNYPAHNGGKRVDNVRFVFKDGVVVEASADVGEDYLLLQLAMDANARRLGEFAIGTNDFIQSVTGSVLLDEKIGGTIHMAVGQSAAPNEGKNPSKIHWDMVHDMRDGGEIRVDGELFYQSGKFLIE